MTRQSVLTFHLNVCPSLSTKPYGTIPYSVQGSEFCISIASSSRSCAASTSARNLARQPQSSKAPPSQHHTPSPAPAPNVAAASAGCSRRRRQQPLQQPGRSPHNNPPPAMPDLRSKTAIVTGATSGIGEACALELARLGATVVMAVRSATKAQATLQRIK